MHRFLVGVAVEFGKGDPGEIVGFLGDDEGAGPGVLQEETDVVVKMSGLGAAGRDEVDVEVEDPGIGDDKVCKTRLLKAFAPGHREDVGIAIGMATGLEPAIELAMMSEEDALTRGVEDPRGTGDVPDGEGTLETIRMRGDKIAEAPHEIVLAGVAPGIGIEEVEEGLAMHGKGVAINRRRVPVQPHLPAGVASGCRVG